MQTVGVMLAENLMDRSPKRELLFFDKIAALGLEAVIKFHRYHIHGEPYLADELEWLREQSLLIDATEVSRAFASYMNNQVDLLGVETLREFVHASEIYKRQQEVAAKIEKLPWKKWDNGSQTLSAGGDPTDLMELDLKLRSEMRTFICRAYAAEARNEQRADAVCLDMPTLVQPSSSQSMTRGDVICILVDNFPMPDEGTPWEQIKEFRSDPDSERRLSQLKNWVRDAVKAHIDRTEFEERLSYLGQEYKDHIRLHKLKSSQGAIEVVVTTTAEIAENLIKINWSKAAKALFSIKRGRIELLEAERKAPGREIAYILKANEAFKGE